MSVDLTVSVVMTTYNGEKWVEKQLTSILAQTRAPIEIVVCDDGSTDATLDVVAGIALSSSVPIKLKKNPDRLGWRENFIRASSLASGDVVAFSDQDDIWVPDKLEKVVDAFSPSVTLVVHGAELIDGHDAPIGRLRRGPSRAVRYPALSAPYWRSPLGFSMTFRSHLLKYNDLWPRSVDQVDLEQRAAHDQWFWFLATAFGDVVYLDEPLVRYRLHGGNAMGHSRSRMRARDYLDSARGTQAKLVMKAAVLTNRASVLAAISADEDVSADALARARGAYSDAALFARSRLGLLRSRGTLRRLVGVFGLDRRFSYADEPLPEGRQELARDLIAVVLGSSVPASHPSRPSS